MNRLTFGLAVAAAVGFAPAARAGEACYGTAVEFVDSPKEAAALARKQEKLVFVLHVSGHFEDPQFT